MRRAILAFALALVLLLTGCVVQSIHGLYTENDLVFDPALIGTWAEKENPNLWTLEKNGEKAYTLSYTENQVTAKFETRLVRLGPYLFLDTYPKDAELKNSVLAFHLMPAHLFTRIWIEKDTIRYAALDYEWMKKQLEEKKVTLSHEIEDGSVILTGSTKELQAFLQKYADDPEAFPNPKIMHRVVH